MYHILLWLFGFSLVFLLVVSLYCVGRFSPLTNKMVFPGTADGSSVVDYIFYGFVQLVVLLLLIGAPYFIGWMILGA